MRLSCCVPAAAWLLDLAALCYRRPRSDGRNVQDPHPLIFQAGTVAVQWPVPAAVFTALGPASCNRTRAPIALPAGSSAHAAPPGLPGSCISHHTPRTL